MAICRFCGESETAPGICARCGAGQPRSLVQPTAGSPVTGRPESGEPTGAAVADAEVAAMVSMTWEQRGRNVTYTEAAEARVGVAALASRRKRCRNPRLRTSARRVRDG